MLSYQEHVAKYLLFDTFGSAQELLRRARDVEAFNFYLRQNKWLVVSAMLIIFLSSAACAMGILTLLTEMHWVFVLPLLVLLPIVLGGSLFVQVYVFFSWIEGRSLARVLGNRHRPTPGPVATWLQNKLRLDMSPFPPVPWVWAIMFVFAPLVLLANSWMAAAWAVVGLVFMMSVFYARFER